MCVQKNNHFINTPDFVNKIIDMACRPEIENVVIDGFCGLGGVTEGFGRLPNYMVIFCINHWDIAIDTHRKNHPDCIHLQEDFRVADLTLIKYVLGEIRKRRPEMFVHLWLSLECTNFSNAKGGMSRNADSRTLADHADRYVIELDPDKIWIENVKEFLLWGPMLSKVVSAKGKKKETIYVPKGMDEVEYINLLIGNGHIVYSPLIVVKKDEPKKDKFKGIFQWMLPDPDFKGVDFFRWQDLICGFGYHSDYKILNCADFGVPQHRLRLIMQFNRTGVKALWPKKTHDKKGKHGLPKWLPVRDCLDLEDEGESVLSFVMEKGVLVPRIEAEATIDRLITGATRFVLPKRKRFNDQLGLEKEHLVDHYFGNGYMKPVSQPAGVTGTKDGAALHTLEFLSQNYTGIQKNVSPESPSRAITGTGGNLSLVTSHFIDQQYSSGQRNKGIDDVAGALLQVPKQQLVEVEHFVMSTQFNNIGHSLDTVAATQTANRKHFYIVNFQWFNDSFKDICEPANTIIARMDKSPNYLIVLETGELAIEIFENDPPHYVKLKKFMAENGIIKINMRMLKIEELLKIMTIREAKHLAKSATANKKMIGNAVPSNLIEILGAASSPSVRLAA